MLLQQTFLIKLTNINSYIDQVSNPNFDPLKFKPILQFVRYLGKYKLNSDDALKFSALLLLLLFS